MDAGALPSAVVMHICAVNPVTLERIHRAAISATFAPIGNIPPPFITSVASARRDMPPMQNAFVYHMIVSGCSFLMRSPSTPREPPPRSSPPDSARMMIFDIPPSTAVAPAAATPTPLRCLERVAPNTNVGWTTNTPPNAHTGMAHQMAQCGFSRRMSEAPAAVTRGEMKVVTAASASGR